ncbi:MAG: hypothetical protein ABI451_08990 [Dokdonella sp.]
MTVNWTAGLVRWMPYSRRGTVFPLNHLHPFRYEVTIPASEKDPKRVVMVHVGFALHTFTRERDSSTPSEEVYSDDRESRMFDDVRYELSKLLPEIIRSLGRRHCAFAKQDNYVTVEATMFSGETVNYGVFFNLKRWKERGPMAVLLVVQSAYVINVAKRSPAQGKITFRSLLLHALRGTKPRKP